MAWRRGSEGPGMDVCEDGYNLARNQTGMGPQPRSLNDDYDVAEIN